MPRQRTGLPDSLAGLRVLCVDNDSDILAGMAALLGQCGREAHCAAHRHLPFHRELWHVLQMAVVRQHRRRRLRAPAG